MVGLGICDGGGDTAGEFDEGERGMEGWVVKYMTRLWVLSWEVMPGSIRIQILWQKSRLPSHRSGDELRRLRSRDTSHREKWRGKGLGLEIGESPSFSR